MPTWAVWSSATVDLRPVTSIVLALTSPSNDSFCLCMLSFRNVMLSNSVWSFLFVCSKFASCSLYQYRNKQNNTREIHNERTCIIMKLLQQVDQFQVQKVYNFLCTTYEVSINFDFSKTLFLNWKCHSMNNKNQRNHLHSKCSWINLYRICFWYSSICFEAPWTICSLLWTSP